MRTAAGLGTMPAASTMVPASMVASARWTRPGSIERTGVEVRMSAPRRSSTRVADGRERGVDLRQDAGAGLEQVEAELVAAEARIVAQDVLGERGELAEQLDTDQPAADHDEGEAPAAELRVRRGIGPLELLDHVVPDQERVGHAS